MSNEVNNKLDFSRGDFWQQLPDEVKQSLNEAKDQLDRGEGIPHEQIMAEIKERFCK